MNQFRFRDWKVYSDTQALFTILLKISSVLPKEYRFSLGEQLIRAGLSIVLNIAEGSGKHSAKETCRFFDIALGSAYEVLACCDSLRNNDLLGTKELLDIETRIDSICRQLGGLKKKFLEKA